MTKTPAGFRQRQKWLALLDDAEREIASVRATLPRPVAQAIKNLPVTLQPLPDPDYIAEGLPDDTLGLFVGPSLREQESPDPLPPQILLFLENIHDYAGPSPAAYRREVRRTFLHELGHYLGLDEDDLLERNLD
ncbi:MAG TPA: metallopeptidase family protein [Kiritimatiellia bacterium]|nr:metallopeptidase family protein [Kiritimatiellia bacterium]